MATGTIILPVQSAKLPASNPAVIDGAENNFRLLFDASTDESCLWQFRMPVNYASALVAKIQYSMTSATADEVIFQVAVMAVSDGDSADINTDSYDTANDSSATTVPGTVGYLDEISITLTNADSVAAGDYVKIKINRDADDGSDNATGDAEVVAVSLEYTTT